MPVIRYTGFKRVRFFEIDPVTGELDTDNPIDLGKLYKGTVKVTRADGTVEEHYSEDEPDTPLEVFETKGLAQLAFSMTDQEAEKQKMVLGGEIVDVDDDKVYRAPRAGYSATLGAELETKVGHIIRFYKLRISARENWDFEANKLLMTDVVARVLNPDVETLLPYERVYVGAAAGGGG